MEKARSLKEHGRFGGLRVAGGKLWRNGNSQVGWQEPDHTRPFPTPSRADRVNGGKGERRETKTACFWLGDWIWWSNKFLFSFEQENNESFYGGNLRCLGSFRYVLDSSRTYQFVQRKRPEKEVLCVYQVNTCVCWYSGLGTPSTLQSHPTYVSSMCHLQVSDVFLKSGE